MAGRGRGRPSARAQVDAAPVVAERRSTRQQQNNQQQQSHQDAQIDPAITAASQNADMAPPPLPASASRDSNPNGRRFTDVVARRGTRREFPDSQLSSMPSLTELPGSSSEIYEEETPSSSAPGTELVASAYHESFTMGSDRFQTPRSGSALMQQWARSQSLPLSTPPTPGQSRGTSKMMKEYLPLLQDFSEKLTSLLLSFDPRWDQADQHEWEVQRASREDLFRSVFKTYLRNPSSTAAEIGYVLEQLDVRRGQPLYHAVTKIIPMANLAFLLDELTLITVDKRLTVLQSLDNIFPGSCIARDAKEERIRLDEQIIDQVCDIRVQLLLHSLQMLKAEPAADAPSPLELLSSIFLDNTTEAGLQKLMVTQQDVELHDLQLPLKAAADINPGAGMWEWEIVKKRVRDLYGMLDDDVTRLDLGPIFEIFPTEEFLEKLRGFLAETFNKTKAYLEGDSQVLDGGVESQVQSQLLGEAESQNDNGIFGALKDAAGGLEATEDAGGGLSNQEILSSNQVQSSAYPPAPSVGYPNFSSYNDPPLQLNGSIYAQSAAQAVTQTRKRRVPSGGETGQPPAKKPRGRRKQDATPASSVTPSTAQFSDPAGESQYPPPPSSAAGFEDTDFEAVSQRSRAISAANRKAREPQVRSAWVRNDVKQLIKAVDVYKCKWSTIEKEIKNGTIPFEIPRDQQALRDKARLLKQDFLKADGILPASFDLVVLGKKEREAVKAVGKNPDRKEADIGPDGRLRNTEYNPESTPSATPVPASAAEAGPVAAMPEAPMGAPHVEDEVQAGQDAA
ncbi:hypothetical protein B0T16DRAFT_399102 [Cercophora newfieldiana]|uniref:Uncharacterized protein n=1 Tax=Cercophora newfieldiana TaxID=92897 RepID=A0AA40CYP5_9PEZI|nr:hypothetical protein B0T16DRAFT_399102 [Cercophora newfieldiana]